MDTQICPRCGASIPSDSAFCGICGTPISAQQTGIPAGGSPPPAPPAGNAPQPPGTPPSAGAYPPPGALPPPPGAYPPPPGAYVPGFPAAKVIGNNTKWGIGLGVAALFCCGPFTAIPGFFLAKKDMDEYNSGRAPQLDVGWSKVAYYLNIVALVLFVLGICLFWGRLGMLRRF